MANYQLGGLNWVKFGSFGMSLFLMTAATADSFYGFKWRDNSRRWTNRVKIHRSQLIGPIREDDLSDARLIRAIDAMPEQLSADKSAPWPTLPGEAVS